MSSTLVFNVVGAPPTFKSTIYGAWKDVSTTPVGEKIATGVNALQVNNPDIVHDAYIAVGKTEAEALDNITNGVPGRTLFLIPAEEGAGLVPVTGYSYYYWKADSSILIHIAQKV